MGRGGPGEGEEQEGWVGSLVRVSWPYIHTRRAGYFPFQHFKPLVDGAEDWAVCP